MCIRDRYMWDGKPMIVGDPNDPALSAEAKAYFRIKASVWPNAARTDDGLSLIHI